MSIDPETFFGQFYRHPVIRALCLTWADGDATALAVVAGGYVSYKLGYTKTFSGNENVFNITPL